MYTGARGPRGPRAPRSEQRLVEATATPSSDEEDSEEENDDDEEYLPSSSSLPRRVGSETRMMRVEQPPPPPPPVVPMVDSVREACKSDFDDEEMSQYMAREDSQGSPWSLEGEGDGGAWWAHGGDEQRGVGNKRAREEEEEHGEEWPRTNTLRSRLDELPLRLPTPPRPRMVEDDDSIRMHYSQMVPGGAYGGPMYPTQHEYSPRPALLPQGYYDANVYGQQQQQGILDGVQQSVAEDYVVIPGMTPFSQDVVQPPFSQEAVLPPFSQDAFLSSSEACDDSQLSHGPPPPPPPPSDDGDVNPGATTATTTTSSLTMEPEFTRDDSPFHFESSNTSSSPPSLFRGTFWPPLNDEQASVSLDAMAFTDNHLGGDRMQSNLIRSIHHPQEYRLEDPDVFPPLELNDPVSVEPWGGVLIVPSLGELNGPTVPSYKRRDIKPTQKVWDMPVIPGF